MANLISEKSIKLFLGAMLQVGLVSINAYLISQGKYLSVFVVGCMISYVWTFNVQKVVFGELSDRLTYSFGAGVGGVLGLYIAKNIVNWL